MNHARAGAGPGERRKPIAFEQLIAGEVDTLLSTERMRSKLSKLAASAAAERHRFLVILQAAFSLPVFDSLVWAGCCSPPA
jgi:hypothetical protein